MKNKTEKSHWSVIIVGGGIVGAGIFRDLSLHNVDTLIIDKNKISSYTSKSSSKMLHGGIRYLENLDLALVKEALTERNLWLRIAPHLCYKENFIIPVYKNSNRPLWMILIGIGLYHYLSGSFNNLLSMLGVSSLTKKFPQIRKEGLKGAGLYEDAVVDDERLTIEVVQDGLLNENCSAFEHHQLEELSKEAGLYKLKIKSGDEIKNVTCNDLVFATGPFTDILLKKLNAFPWSPKLLLSKGSHIWIKRDSLELPNPVVLTPNDGRVIFVIPYTDKILVGTTEVPLDGPPKEIKASPEEITYLINNINEFFTEANINQEHVIGSYAGIRPLVKEGSSNLGKTSRDHHIYQPDQNTYVILGGKYTTFRSMAADLAARIIRKRNRPYNPSLSMLPFRNGKRDQV